MKTIKLTSEPYIKGYDGAFMRFVDEEGDELVGGIWNYWYEGSAEDDDGNKYRVVWDVKESWLENEDEDESRACYWDCPEQITDEQGRNVTDRVELIL